MKARRITLGDRVEGLPFVAVHRKGDLPAESLRRQARGEIGRAPPQDRRPSRFLRTILLNDGPFAEFDADGGALLTFVVSGALTATTASGASERFEPGDVLLTDAVSAGSLTFMGFGQCRLIQLGVPMDWPDHAEAAVQDEGTIIPREGMVLKRLDTGSDNRSYFREFETLFPEETGCWSNWRSIAGFRFMCWEDGFFDWHPEVVNHLGVVLAGELAVEASGDGVVNVFRAGDVLLAADRTGTGHINRCRGKTYVCLIEIETDKLW